jgi:hypothetical protein
MNPEYFLFWSKPNLTQSEDITRDSSFFKNSPFFVFLKISFGAVFLGKSERVANNYFSFFIFIFVYVAIISQNSFEIK